MRDLRAPLYNLLIKDAKFRWTPVCNTSLNQAKSILASNLLLAHYDHNQKIRVPQTRQITAWTPLPLTVTQMDRGMQLSMSSDHFCWPRGSTVKLGRARIHPRSSEIPADASWTEITSLTGHEPLLTMFGSKKEIPVCAANRWQRWATALIAYNFDMRHRSTTKFRYADAFSRLIAN